MSKSFGGVVANNAIDLTVPEGSIVGLIGPNGSGKTTLFNCIAGYHRVDRGSIRFVSRQISGLRMPEIARLGLVRTFQQTNIYSEMTCLQNMQISVPHRDERFTALFRRFSPEVIERAKELLEFVDLHVKHDQLAGELSFGQQRLLELAMGLMSEPRLLLLDEPSAGVHPVMINGLIDRLQRANADHGISLVVIEHNMHVVMSLADHIYCLAHGELLAHGRPDQIRSDQRVIAAYLGERGSSR